MTRIATVMALSALVLALGGCDCTGVGGFDPNCEPDTCEELGWECGNPPDGCGGTLDCGSCPSGQECGGRGVEGRCATPCTPRSCDEIGDYCGPMPDGCGDFVVCVECELPETCGGGGVPSKCGVASSASCTTLTCGEQGLGCGLAGDGCGGIIDCGECPEGQSCGGGGVPSQCGTPTCHPLTCQEAGAECGRAPDGCGGLTDHCGDCPEGQACHAGGVLNQCADEETETACVGYCEHQVACPEGQSTTLTGTVRAPNGVEPLYNVVVYVPNSLPLAPIDDGIACVRCEEQDWGDLLVAAVSGPDGTFELEDVPANVDFPLVVQAGKWRRQVTIPAVNPCTTTALSAEQTRMPRNSTEGHIPRIAISTGSIDGLECVLYKAGVDRDEFTTPDGEGRIHLYRANGAWPDQWYLQNCNNCTADNPGACPASCRHVMADNLYNSQATLDGYDIVIFGCEATLKHRDAGSRGRLLQYVNAGGRLFLSHWAFDWLWTNSYSTSPLHTTCNWSQTAQSGSLSMYVSQAFVEDSFERGQAFREWLDVVGASNPSSGILTIDEPRAHCRSAIDPGRVWVYTTQQAHGGDSVQQLTFNTPVGASEDDMCGRVLYSAFHVTIGWTDNAWFPNHCAGSLTAQEKVLLFMLFDLASCISDDGHIITPCTALTCKDSGVDCGLMEDGCGGVIDCGECPIGCEPIECEPNQCGYIADGCGDVIDCGDCPPGLFCGGDGVPNECGSGCVPLTCESAQAECGDIADGCGGIIECGECPPGMVCVSVDGRMECRQIG